MSKNGMAAGGFDLNPKLGDFQQAQDALTPMG